MKAYACNRRQFLRTTATAALGAPFAVNSVADRLRAAEQPAAPGTRSDAKVAIASCRSYGPAVRTALDRCFDAIGGIGSLVKGKTVTVKINLTGTDFTPFLNRPVGETFMTHDSTVFALTSALFAAGAR